MAEPKICPDCPLYYKYMSYISYQSYTTKPNKKSALRTCQELRAIAKSFGEECRHFKGESLDNFLIFFEVSNWKTIKVLCASATATTETMA